ncbi:helix-turn-helix transcriptional regulator [Streptomyces sp. JJ66]|uniref:helix-turn-helix domain-containing protein n=1 Tax=Streptomyces sp. JJ66 TaxID=2803843 RepID=UPI001C58B130|nr:helix-turn-helix domain-containing protein [Streptomyces sp. JJ66]MBW1602458.1 helix-turn-helix transcriptional regulator [Streptomyces sp. JJ66]
MLELSFSDRALARLRVAKSVDPMWEIALSLHLLQNQEEALVFGPWRREVRAALQAAGLTAAVRGLALICPATGYFPDFLTPGRGDPDVATGVDRVLSTPRSRLCAELSRLYPRGPVPRGVRALALGDPSALRGLGGVLQRYHQVAVAPYTAAMRGQAATDRARRAEAALDRGAEGLLASYAQAPGWEHEGGYLRAPYPRERSVDVQDRALTVVPSFFCVRTPLALVDDSLPPVLVHPLSPALGWLTRLREAEVRPPVTQLVGSSRAEMLEILERPMTTTALAAALRLALSTASRHASVLREAGLVATRREGNRVLHERTALGRALLDGSAPAPRTASRVGAPLRERGAEGAGRVPAGRLASSGERQAAMPPSRR